MPRVIISLTLYKGIKFYQIYFKLNSKFKLIPSLDVTHMSHLSKLSIFLLKLIKLIKTFSSKLRDTLTVLQAIKTR